VTAFGFVVGGPLGEEVDEVYPQLGTEPLYNGIPTMIVVALAVVVVGRIRTAAGKKPAALAQEPSLIWRSQ
jgi:hypothetical protein